MFCKQCGKNVPDEARFCRYCGTATGLGAAPVILPEVETLVVSGTVPTIPDMDIPQDSAPQAPIATQNGEAWDTAAGFGAAAYGAPSQNDTEYEIDLEDGSADVGSYQDIMAEFSAGGYAGTQMKPPQQPAASEPVGFTPTPVKSRRKPVVEESGSKKRTVLIAVSLVLILVLLIAATVLCVNVLLPNPENDPIVSEEPVEPSELVLASQQPSPSPSASPRPSDSSVLMPQPSDGVVMPEIAPPQQSMSAIPSEEPVATATPSPVPSVSPSPTTAPSPSPTPTPTHNAASGNTTLAGTRYVENVGYSAYFRSAPEQSDSNIIKQVLLGTKVDYIEDYNSVYTKVKYDGTYGYIATEYLSKDKPNLTVTDTVYVCGVDYAAYLRSSPKKSDSNAYSYVYLDQALDYIETTSSGYVRVKSGSYYGFVHRDYISFSEPNTTVNKTMYITGVQNGAYLLQYPRSGTTVINTLKPDTPVGYIEDSLNGYCKVSYNGTVGYVNGAYLTEINPNDPATLNQEAHTALLEYTLNHSLPFYYGVDLNGDGITEMLASKEGEPLDDFYTCSGAVLLAYQEGKVVEVGTLNDLGGLAPMTVLEDEAEETVQIVTQWGGSGKNIITIYTLTGEGKLTEEIWLAETTDSGTKYTHTDTTGTVKEITAGEFEGKSYSLDEESFIIEFEASIA